jgi:hypothetical protein
MILKIPPEIQVGAHTIRIRWSDRVLDAVPAPGQESCREQIIRLHHRQTKTAAFEALLHEVDHIVSYYYGIEAGDSEAAIMARAAGFAQVLLSMGIEPDFSAIPDERYDENIGLL